MWCNYISGLPSVNGTDAGIAISNKWDINTRQVRYKATYVHLAAVKYISNFLALKALREFRLLFELFLKLNC